MLLRMLNAVARLVPCVTIVNYAHWYGDAVIDL